VSIRSGILTLHVQRRVAFERIHENMEEMIPDSGKPEFGFTLYRHVCSETPDSNTSKSLLQTFSNVEIGIDFQTSLDTRYHDGEYYHDAHAPIQPSGVSCSQIS
jgi:hypothetical protein